MAAIFATLALTTDVFLTARDGFLHLPDPMRPAVSPVFTDAERLSDARLVANGTPGRARCGAVPFTSTNRYGAETLYAGLTECRMCAARAELAEVFEAMSVEDGTLSMAETARLDRRKHALRDEIEALAAARVTIRG